MKIVYKIEDINKDSWNKLLSKSDYSTPFQSYHFYELYNSVKGYSADVIAVEKSGNYLALAVITIHKEGGVKKFFSKRGVVFGGPLFTNTKSADFLLSFINSFYKRKLIYLEIRNNFDYSNLLSIYNKYSFNFTEHLNVIINVEGNIETLLSKMKGNRRREIRQSYKQGATVREASNIKEIGDLYSILSNLYDSKVKLPYPSLSFFIKLVQSKIGVALIVMHNNKIIGGTFCIVQPNVSIHTMYYVGVQAYHKRIYPTHLAVTGVLEYAVVNNIPIVDLMGAGKPNEEYGVRKYKMAFGGNLVNYGRNIRIFNPILYQVGVLGVKILSKLK